MFSSKEVEQAIGIQWSFVTIINSLPSVQCTGLELDIVMHVVKNYRIRFEQITTNTHGNIYFVTFLYL
jgi:hypothetical protein